MKNNQRQLSRTIFGAILVGVSLGVAFANSAHADESQNSNYMVIYPNGTAEIDMGSYCLNKVGICEFKRDGVDVILSSSTYYNSSQDIDGSFSSLKGALLQLDPDQSKEVTNPVVQTNVPIKSIDIGFTGLIRYNDNGYNGVCGYNNSQLNLSGKQTSFTEDLYTSGAINRGDCGTASTSGWSAISKFYTISAPDVRYIDLSSDLQSEGAIVLRVVVDVGSSASSFHDITITAATSLAIILQQAENNLAAFSAGISKLDRPHLLRFKEAIDRALAALKFNGNEAQVPLTDENVVEAVRLVVVMGEVAGEMLNNYSDTPWARQPIANLRDTVQVLRSQYFSDSLFAGRPSKSIADLADMIEFELRGVMITLGATTNGNVPASLRNVWKHAQILEGVVEGMRGGDAQAYPQVQALASAWNSNKFQLLLKRLLNSGRDLQGVIQPKLRNLLMGIESLNGVTGVYFVVPSGR